MLRWMLAAGAFAWLAITLSRMEATMAQQSQFDELAAALQKLDTDLGNDFAALKQQLLDAQAKQQVDLSPLIAQVTQMDAKYSQALSTAQDAIGAAVPDAGTGAASGASGTDASPAATTDGAPASQ